MSDNLKATVISGARMTVAARLFRAFQGIAALSILSRYLSPTEFGLMSLVAFVGGIAQIFTDFGTRIALVQRQTTTRMEESSVFWWNLGTASLIATAILVSAPWIAGLMDEPGVTGPLRWMAPIFVIGALQSVPLSMLERRFAFGTIASSELSAAFSSSLVAIGMAIAGFKIEALIAQVVVGSVVSALVITSTARWRPRLQFSFAALKPLLSYGSYVTASSVVQLLSTRANRPVVGQRLSATDLGYLAVAEQIVLTPLRITVQMVRKVMFPVMATIQDDDVRLRRGYLAMQHGLMTIMAPVAFGLWAVADPVVALLLGKEWATVAAIMGYMTLRSVFSSFNDLNSVIFAAKGWAKFQFQWSIFSAVITIGALLLSVDYGIVAVAAGQLGATILLTPLNSYFALRLISQPKLEVFTVLVRPIAAGAVMGAAVAVLQAYLADLASLVQLVICIPAGAAIYLVAILLLDRARFLPLFRQILARRKVG